tara:strand:- start:704 stop:1612 length:909 start_codon:yes stop_codon:yes gene_type:complete
MEEKKGLMALAGISSRGSLIRSSDIDYVGRPSPALKFHIDKLGLENQFEDIYNCLSEIERDKATHQAVCGLWGETRGMYVRVNTHDNVNIEDGCSVDLANEDGKFRMGAKVETKDWLKSKSLVLLLNKHGDGKIGFANMSNYVMEPGLVEWYVPDYNFREILSPLSGAVGLEANVWSEPKALAAFILAATGRVHIGPKDEASRGDLKPLYHCEKRKWHRAFNDFGTRGVGSKFEAEDLVLLYRSTIRKWAKDEIEKFNGNGPKVCGRPLDWSPGVSVQFKGRSFPKRPLTRHKSEKTVGISL